MQFDYNFPTVSEPAFSYTHDVTISNFDETRIVRDVRAKKVDLPVLPAPFFEVDIKYDYSESGDGSIVGPLVVTSDKGKPFVVDWGVSPPAEELMKRAGAGQKVPNHSIKLELSGENGEDLRKVFIGVKNAIVEILVKEASRIGSHGGKATLSGDPKNYFATSLKAHDISRKKMPSGDVDMVPAKFLNLFGTNQTDKATGKRTNAIKTYFYMPDGRGGKFNIHVKNLVRKKLTLQPYIFFQRVYCGANLSIQTFLDSAMVLDVKSVQTKAITSSAKERLQDFDAAEVEKFKALMKGLDDDASAGDPPTEVKDTAPPEAWEDPGSDESKEGRAAPPPSPASLPGSDGDEGGGGFDAALTAAVETAKPAPKRGFRRVG